MAGSCRATPARRAASARARKLASACTGGQVGGLDDRALGGGDEQLGLSSIAAHRRDLGGGRAGGQQAQQRLDDRGFARRRSGGSGRRRGRGARRTTGRDDDGDPGGGVAGDDRAERAGGERGEQHGEVVDGLDRGVRVVDRRGQRLACGVDELRGRGRGPARGCARTRCARAGPGRRAKASRPAAPVVRRRRPDPGQGRAGDDVLADPRAAAARSPAGRRPPPAAASSRRPGRIRSPRRDGTAAAAARAALSPVARADRGSPAGCCARPPA